MAAASALSEYHWRLRATTSRCMVTVTIRLLRGTPPAVDAEPGAAMKSTSLTFYPDAAAG